jgi:hypothetical protein
MTVLQDRKALTKSTDFEKREREVRKSVIIFAIVSAILAAVLLSGISILGPYFPYRDVFLVITGMLLGFIVLGFEEYFFYSVERARSKKIQQLLTAINSLQLVPVRRLMAEAFRLGGSSYVLTVKHVAQAFSIASFSSRKLGVDREVMSVLTRNGQGQLAPADTGQTIGQTIHLAHGNAVGTAFDTGYFVNALRAKLLAKATEPADLLDGVQSFVTKTFRLASADERLTANVARQFEIIKQKKSLKDSQLLLLDLLTLYVDNIHETASLDKLENFLATKEITEDDFLSSGRELAESMLSSSYMIS